MENMKKLWKPILYVVAVIAVFSGGFYVGLSDTVPKSQYTELETRYNEILVEIGKTKTDSKTTAKSEEAIQNTELKEQVAEFDNRGLTPISFGENVLVETKYGNFEIQIDEVEPTEYDANGCEAVAVKCVVNNISYVGSYNQNKLSGLNICEETSILQLTDMDGISFPFYHLSATLDEYALCHDLQIGSKAREAYLFLVKYDVKNVSIVINNKYILHTSI